MLLDVLDVAVRVVFAGLAAVGAVTVVVRVCRWIEDRDKRHVQKRLQRAVEHLRRETPSATWRGAPVYVITDSRGTRSMTPEERAFVDEMLGPPAGERGEIAPVERASVPRRTPAHWHTDDDVA